MKMRNTTFENVPDNRKEEILKTALEHLEDRRIDLELLYLADWDEVNEETREEIAGIFGIDENEINSEVQQDIKAEYGLCIDYVEPDGREGGYIRYQFSWGGPSEELRIYDGGLVEFVYLDWGIGVGFDVTDDEVFKKVAEEIKGVV